MCSFELIYEYIVYLIHSHIIQLLGWLVRWSWMYTPQRLTFGYNIWSRAPFSFADDDLRCCNHIYWHTHSTRKHSHTMKERQPDIRLALMMVEILGRLPHTLSWSSRAMQDACSPAWKSVVVDARMVCRCRASPFKKNPVLNLNEMFGFYVKAIRGV